MAITYRKQTAKQALLDAEKRKKAEKEGKSVNNRAVLHHEAEARRQTARSLGKDKPTVSHTAPPATAEIRKHPFPTSCVMCEREAVISQGTTPTLCDYCRPQDPSAPPITQNAADRNYLLITLINDLRSLHRDIVHYNRQTFALHQTLLGQNALRLEERPELAELSTQAGLKEDKTLPPKKRRKTAH